MWYSHTFWRLFGTFGVLWVVTIAILGFVVEHRMEQRFLEQIESGLRTKVVLLREMVLGRKVGDAEKLQKRIEISKNDIAARITLIAADGTVLADSDKDPRKYLVENHRERPEIQQAMQSGVGITRRRHSATVDQDLMYAALRTDDPTGDVAFVRVGLPLDHVQAQLAELWRLIWTAAAVTALAGMGLAFWLARRTTQPLHELTKETERIAAGEHGRKVFAVGNDEIGQLARSFNHMSENLAVQFTQLAEDRRQLQAVLSGMIEGVIAVDIEQHILFANERASFLLESSLEEARGRKLWEVVRHRQLQEVVQEALTCSECREEELAWNAAIARSLTINVSPLAGSPTHGAVIVIHDMTELRRLERLRHEFVANVSHELKTPLAVIKANVETLQEGAADDPVHRGIFLQGIAEQAERLHMLILDLLSLARIESGEEVFEPETLALNELAQSCLDHHRARAEAKKQILENVSANQDADVLAWADREAVQQILENLVDNALKYTPEGGSIRVRCFVENEFVGLEVQDTGIGIPEPDLPRVFERFYRVDKARSRELGGTGLGLSIVKHLAQAMHGSVRAISRVGQGSVFTVILPRPR